MTKTTTKILVAVLTLGLLGSGIMYAQNVTAQSVIVGKDTIKNTLPTFDSPEIKRVTEIMDLLKDDKIPASEQAALKNELQQIRDTHNNKIDAPTHQKIMDKKELISNYMSQKLETKSMIEVQNEFPINGVYVDDANNALVVNVDSMKFSDEVAKSVLAQVRAIVGNEIDVVIQPMLPMLPQCSQTGDCEPAQGGVKISTFQGSCSLGFKATYAGKNGFITAGHCTDGTTGGGIGQPNYVFWDDIGTAHTNGYKQNSKYDGLFVEANEVISDKIFLNNDINAASPTMYLDGITMEGHVTQGVGGVVTSVSWDGQVGTYWLKDQAFTNYVGQGGDSGGTVWGYTPGNSLKGTHSGGNGVNASIFSKQTNVGTQFPGLTWNFS